MLKRTSGTVYVQHMEWFSLQNSLTSVSATADLDFLPSVIKIMRLQKKLLTSSCFHPNRTPPCLFSLQKMPTGSVIFRPTENEPDWRFSRRICQISVLQKSQPPFRGQSSSAIEIDCCLFAGGGGINAACWQQITVPAPPWVLKLNGWICLLLQH